MDSKAARGADNSQSTGPLAGPKGRLSKHASHAKPHGFAITPQNSRCTAAISDYDQVMLFVFLLLHVISFQGPHTKRFIA
jgi:hypothetical protein